jgi:hypothetical protein
MERSDTPQNMSLGSSEVDQGRSLRKILTRVCLANLCVNGTSSASFCIDFRAVTKRSETSPTHEFWVQSSGSGAFVAKNFDATSFSELVR